MTPQTDPLKTVKVLPKIQSTMAGNLVYVKMLLKIVGHFTPCFGFIQFRASQNFNINVYDIPYLIAMKNSHCPAVALSDSAMRFSTSVFFHESVPPQAPEYLVRAFRKFPEIFVAQGVNGKNLQSAKF
jgi:hypothetical protein